MLTPTASRSTAPPRLRPGRIRRRTRRPAAAGLALIGLALIGLVLAGQVGLVARAATAGAARAEKWYVALGDSYAVGYQPGIGATSGYTGYVAAHEHLRLANFGCGGATTASILQAIGCTPPYGPSAGTGAEAYPTTTQEAAAAAFITAHAGRIGLITVSIGGNDITHCAQTANPVACVATVTPQIKANLTALAADLRHAAGPHVPIVGLTYPDVLLGQWVAKPPDIALATLSVTAFKGIVNPTLSSAYTSAGATFVDVTAATGAYVALTTTVRLAPYGRIPVAVASVCRLSYYCTEGNIHLHTTGYDVMGRLITAAVAKKA